MNIWKNKKWVPMLLKEIEKPFDSKDYIFELKFDGIRAVLFVSPNKVIVQTRNKQDISNLFPELQNIKELVKENTIFDGEIVAFQNGLPSFSKLQERSHLKNISKIKNQSIESPIVFVCFDILYKGSKDLTNLSLLERKDILDSYSENDYFIKTKWLNEQGTSYFKEIQKLNLEGIVAKKKDSPYIINTRSNNWLKIKNFKQETFFIGGYTDTNKNASLTLYLGEKRRNKLYFVGKVSMAKKHKLYNQIIKCKINKTSSFYDYKKEINYITPKLTCKVQYIERTKSNHLRQPIFKEK